MSLGSLVLAAALTSCADLERADLTGLAKAESQVLLPPQETSLDRVFTRLGTIGGFKSSYQGFTPTVNVEYGYRTLREVLEDLARKYGLAYKLSAGTLEVRAPLLPGVGGVSEPRVTKKVDPIFPKDAKAAEAKVVLLLTVCEDGRVRASNAVERPTEIAFINAAQEAIRSWEFDPARKDKLAVPSYYTVTMEFKRAP